MLSRSIIFLFCLFSISLSHAGTRGTSNDNYYGKLSKVKELRTQLHSALKYAHIPQENKPDKIVEHCDSLTSQDCFSHIKHSYKKARKLLFGYLHLKQMRKNYQIVTTYCRQVVTNDDLPPSNPLGEFKIPSHTVLNTEHSWPQSFFSQQESKILQKSDLHALFPAAMKVNSTRGNKPFGEVADDVSDLCDEARFGYNHEGALVFEPSDHNKGNIARAMFYFSVRYNMTIDSMQEKVLRKWHKMDPVDEEEIFRNDEIFELQLTRNPFIDHPEWVQKISDF